MKAQQTEITSAVRKVLLKKRDKPYYASAAHDEWERKYLHKQELIKRRFSKGAKNYTAPAASTITPAATFSRTTGVAPLYVFVDMKATTSTQTTEPFHEILYKVDWGDSVSETWTLTGADKNISWGPLAAHVYTAGGTFTVTLTYYDGVSTTTVSTNTITVTAADTHYSTTNTICVSTSGTFTGKPTGATEVTSSDFDAEVNTYLAAGKRVLFRGGETFTASAKATCNAVGPWTLGSFGTGRAIVNINAGIECIGISAGASTCTDGRILDLELNGQSSRTVTGITADGGFTDVLIRNCKIHDMYQGITFSTGVLDALNGVPFTVPVWDKICLAENDLDVFLDQNPPTVRGGIGIFVSGTRFAALGNDINDTTGAEFPMRVSFAQRYVFQHNNFVSPANDKASITIRGIVYDVGSVTIPAGEATEYGVFSDNWTSHTGTGPPAVFSWGAVSASTNTVHSQVIIESNYVKQWDGGQRPFQISSSGGGSITLRNNIVYIPVATSHYGLGLCGVNTTGDPDKLWIYNNTVYDDDASVAGFAGIEITAEWTNTFMKNNLMYCPNGPTGNTNLVVTGSPTEVTNSTDSPSGGQIHGTDPVFVTTPPTVPADLKIQTSSYAKNAGTAIPVYQDFFRTTRVGGTWDIGAHEFT